MLRTAGPIIAAMLLFPLRCFAASPYVGQTSRTIKALSDQEVAEYLSGKGMGYPRYRLRNTDAARARPSKST